MGTKYTVDNAGIVTLTNDLIVDTNVLKVDTTNNRIGINKTSPAVALQILDSASNTFVWIDALSTFGSYLTFAENGVNQSTIWRVGGETKINIGDASLVKTATFDVANGSVGIGTASPAASSLLEMASTTKGLLAPRMTTVQRDVISSPAAGLLIYNTTTTAFNYFDGSVWAAVGTGGGGGGGATATYTRTYGTGTGAQTIFTVPTYAYPSGNALLVYNGGVLMKEAVDYNLTSATSITFVTAPDSGAELTFVLATAGSAISYNKSVQVAGGVSAAFTVPTYTSGGILVYKDGVLMTAGGSADYLETNATTITMNSIPSAGVVMTFMVAALAYISTPGTFTEVREGFVYAGGPLYFDLATAYTLATNNLKVFRNGQLMTSGAGNDYNETSTTRFTFLNALTAGDIITAVYVVPAVALATPTIGQESRQSFTSTGSPQTFTLASAYLNNGTNLKVYVNGALQKPSTNYSEDNTTQFSFATGLTSGDIVEAIWTSAAVGVISYTPSTEVRQNFVATGAESGLFTLTGGATFTQGGSNLKVYVDGVLMVLGGSNDYTEPSNSQVQFNSGNHPTAGQVVSLAALTQTGALGNFQNRRDEFVSTASQIVFSASFTFVMGGADMQVYNDGVLMKLGDDYYELNNTQVVFYTGRLLNSKVTLVSKIQAAAGDANSVNGISASITPTAGKLCPLDGNGNFPVTANVYAILAAL